MEKANVTNIEIGYYVTTVCPICKAKTSGFSLKKVFIRSCRLCKAIYEIDITKELEDNQ